MDWSVDTLKAYMDTEITHLRESNTQFQAAHLQLHSAEADAWRRTSSGLDKKLDEVSDILTRIQGQLLRSLPRDSFEEEHKALEQKVEELMHWRLTVAGRTVVLIAIVGLCSGVVGVVFGHIFFQQ